MALIKRGEVKQVLTNVYDNCAITDARASGSQIREDYCCARVPRPVLQRRPGSGLDAGAAFYEQLQKTS